MVLTCNTVGANKISIIVRGLALGILMSVRDLCFEENLNK